MYLHRRRCVLRFNERCYGCEGWRACVGHGVGAGSAMTIFCKGGGGNARTCFDSRFVNLHMDNLIERAGDADARPDSATSTSIRVVRWDASMHARKSRASEYRLCDRNPRARHAAIRESAAQTREG